MSGAAMNVLGIDTATGYLGLILQKGAPGEGEPARAVFSANAGFRHGENLLPWIERLLQALALKPRELTLIVCALGPGSFTGLRIGLAAAKGLALAAGCPLVGVPSLDVYGSRYGFFAGTVFPVIDARKSRFYTAAYEGGRRTGEYLDILPGEVRELAAKAKNALITGPDAEKIFETSEKMVKPAHISLLPSTQELPTLLELGIQAFRNQGPLPDGAGPIYVRPSEAEVVRQQKQKI